MGLLKGIVTTRYRASLVVKSGSLVLDCSKIGLRSSQEKTAGQHFCRRREPNDRFHFGIVKDEK